MKEMEIKLDEDGFEELKEEKGEKSMESGLGQSNRPDLRVVQADRDKNGNVIYRNVGGMWKNVSKNGNEFYTLKIGELKLLIFPNEKK